MNGKYRRELKIDVNEAQVLATWDVMLDLIASSRCRSMGSLHAPLDCKSMNETECVGLALQQQHLYFSHLFWSANHALSISHSSREMGDAISQKSNSHLRSLIYVCDKML